MFKQNCCKNSLVKQYICGFLVSFILAIVAFVLVQKSLIGKEALLVVVIIITLIQIKIQTKVFSRLTAASSGKGWITATFLFAILIISLIVIGNLWIIHNLHQNMM